MTLTRFSVDIGEGRFRSFIPALSKLQIKIYLEKRVNPNKKHD